MKLVSKGIEKNAADYLLNLCQILDPFDIKKDCEREYRAKLKSERFVCELVFRLKANYWQEMTMDNRDQQSVGGMGSVSSKGLGGVAPEKNYYLEKKNLFLCINCQLFQMSLHPRIISLWRVIPVIIQEWPSIEQVIKNKQKNRLHQFGNKIMEFH